MPRKRSRTNTERRFQDAVIELVAHSGCAQLGVNLVAQHAGSDKVLIYRYFGGMEGLLESVAENKSWLPSATDLLNDPSLDSSSYLESLSQSVVHHVQSDSATHQILRWRHAIKNPLTDKFNRDWSLLWSDLEKILSEHLDLQSRQRWSVVCPALSLATQARLNEERVGAEYFKYLNQGLEFPLVNESDDSYKPEEDSLPTNLL